MTEREKTELRIKAAKAVGWKIWQVNNPEPHWALHSPAGHLVDVKLSEEGLVVSMPNPLDNPADCEALLVATLQRGWFIDTSSYCRFVIAFDRESFTGFSDNRDANAAYREAVTRACVAAWRARNPAEDGV